MYTSSHANSQRSISYSQKSLLAESEIQRLQREVDSYTRKLEQERKHLIGVEETHGMIKKEYQKTLKQLEQMKTPKSLEIREYRQKITNLEHNIEQQVSKYNEILAYNQKLRAEIDVLRRDKQNFFEVYKNMESELTFKTKAIKGEYMYKEAREDIANKLQEQIVVLKNKNEQQQEEYIDKFEELQTKYKEDLVDQRKSTNMLKNKPNKIVYENFDTQTLLRRRLQKLIVNNKEKVKIIENYTKNMKIIDDAFSIIKDTSGITDIEEIMNTFLKSEEQNHALYNYVNLLTQDIDFLEENNHSLKHEIEDLERELEARKEAQKKTPEDQLLKKKIRERIQAKEGYIESVREKLDEIKNPLENILKDFNQTPFAQQKEVILDDIILNDQTIDGYLSLLEDYATKLLTYLAKKNDEKNIFTSALMFDELNKKNFDATKHNVSNFPAELLEINESTRDIPGHEMPLLDESRLKEIADNSIKARGYHSLNTSNMLPSPEKHA